MSAPLDAPACRRLLVVVPNWVGDLVLASPVLAALRARFARARLTYLIREPLAEVVAGGEWHDRLVYWPQRRHVSDELRTLRLGRRLRRERFDLALLLTNSFRSALVARLARIPRRVGYARDGRSWLLTERLKPLRREGQLVPSPVLEYYAAIAERVGCPVSDRRLRLGISPLQQRQAARLAEHYGLVAGQRYAVINPGAAFGPAKCWLPERFAQVCDRLRAEYGLRSLIVGSPAEAPLMRRIAQQARTDVICCDRPGTTLGTLKPLIRRAALLVCNDSGPRHYGAAFNVPTVTIFGPTHPAWTRTDYPGEIGLQVPVECGPCQLPECPIDHRCMRGVTVEMVIGAVGALLGGAPAPAAAAQRGASAPGRRQLCGPEA